MYEILLVWFDSLPPINNVSVKQGRGSSWVISTKLGLMFLLKDTTQWHRWGSNPQTSVSSQAFYHGATALPWDSSVCKPAHEIGYLPYYELLFMLADCSRISLLLCKKIWVSSWDSGTYCNTSSEGSDEPAHLQSHLSLLSIKHILLTVL